MIEENTYQALCEIILIKRSCCIFYASESEEDNDFLLMTFPRKLWKIFESVQLKPIWWDEDGPSIVINKELIKKEVLERNAPFRIFKTDKYEKFTSA